MAIRQAVIVDDDDDTRALLARVGRAAGFRVLEAGCATEVASLVEQQQPIDIVVSDIAMPGMDGIALARQLRASMPELPIILVSGFTHRGVLAAATQAGARTVLAKPIDPFVLATLMKAHCMRAESPTNAGHPGTEPELPSVAREPGLARPRTA